MKAKARPITLSKHIRQRARELASIAEASARRYEATAAESSEAGDTALAGVWREFAKAEAARSTALRQLALVRAESPEQEERLTEAAEQIIRSQSSSASVGGLSASERARRAQFLKQGQGFMDLAAKILVP